MKKKVTRFLNVHSDIIIKLLAAIISAIIGGGCLGGWVGIKIGIGIVGCGIAFGAILALLFELITIY